MDYILATGFCVLCACVIVLVRVFVKNENTLRFIKAIPQILDTIALYVKEADRLNGQILIEYMDESVTSGLDARLLWVLDQVQNYVKVHYNVNIDIVWLTAQIEHFVEQRKQG